MKYSLIVVGLVRKKEDFDHDEYMQKYADWVGQNISRISLVTEYDQVSLGLDWMEWWRDRFWKNIPQDKFIPIWHAEYGSQELDRLCNNYSRVGVVRPSAADFEARLRNLIGRTGVKLHGVGITAPDMLSRVPFTVTSLSWLSPGRHGQIAVWAQNKMIMYSKTSVVKGLKNHKSDIEKAGFNYDLIEAREAHETNSYAAWVWRKFEAQLLEKAEVRHGLFMIDNSDM